MIQIKYTHSLGVVAGSIEDGQSLPSTPRDISDNLVIGCFFCNNSVNAFVIYDRVMCPSCVKNRLLGKTPEAIANTIATQQKKVDSLYPELIDLHRLWKKEVVQ